MNSQQRRQPKRLGASLKEQIIGNATLKSPSQSQTAHKESPSRLKRGLQAFRNTLSKTKVLVTLVLTGCSLVGGYALLRPHVSVEPSLSLNPVDPYTTQFTLKNENRAFEIHSIESVCWPRNM